MKKLRTYFRMVAFVIYLITNNILAQVSDKETVRYSTEDSITVMPVEYIFPHNKTELYNRTINYFSKESSNDNHFENMKFLIYDFEFTIGKNGTVKKKPFKGNPSTPINPLRQKIMSNYWKKILKNYRWDFTKTQWNFSKSHKVNFYLRVVKYKDGYFKLFAGNDTKSFNGYEILP